MSDFVTVRSVLGGTADDAAWAELSARASAAVGGTPLNSNLGVGSAAHPEVPPKGLSACEEASHGHRPARGEDAA